MIAWVVERRWRTLPWKPYFLTGTRACARHDCRGFTENPDPGYTYRVRKYAREGS